MISPIASTGRPTELNTIVKVTSPTLGDACCSDRGESRGADDDQVVGQGQWNIECLCGKYDCHALHDGGSVHIDGCTKWDREG